MSGSRSAGGFTTLELIVALAISGLLGGALLSTVLVANGVINRTTNAFAQDHDLEAISATFTRDIEQAIKVCDATTPTPNCLTRGVPAPAGMTSLVVTGVDLNNVNWTATYTYDPAAGTLTRVYNQGALTTSFILARYLAISCGGAFGITWATDPATYPQVQATVSAAGRQGGGCAPAVTRTIVAAPRGILQ